MRQFFALANQHMRWELNDLARRLDEQPAAVELREGLVPAPASSVSGLTPDGLRMLRAIDELPEDEREVFDLVRIQGMTQVEAAELLGVSAVTVKRRLSRGLRLLAEQLADLRPGKRRPTRSRCMPAGEGFWVSQSRQQPPRRATTWLPNRWSNNCWTRSRDSGALRKRSAPTCPELLPEVRRRWQRMCAVEAELDALFPTPGPDPAPIPPLRHAAPTCRRSRAMRWRRCSAAGAWASSTRPGTAASTAWSPSRC